MKIYSFNEKFFSDINQESCYWAGFLAADGNLYYNESRNSYRLNCTIKDEDHLHKLKLAMNADQPVKKYTKYYHFNVDGAKCLFEDLKAFNIIPRKSLVLEPPTVLTKERHVRSFIRGYFDGDGSLYNSAGQAQISFVGTEVMLNWIKNNLSAFIRKELNNKIEKAKGVFRFRVSGEKAIDCLKWIYRESSDDLRLARKYNRYLVYIS